MSWNLKEHGEDFEVQASEFVSENIPNYERIWSIFIGHKGNGQIAEVPGISEEANNTRKLFAEHHYTILESAYLMFKIAREEQNIKTSVNFEEYCQLINNIIVFHAHAGRIKDNFSECFNIMGYPMKTAADPTADIKAFYEERHVVLHGKKIPLSIDEYGYLIPSISNSENIHGWEAKKYWKEARDIKKEYISDSMTNVLSKLFPKINTLFGELYAYVKEFIKENDIKLSPPTVRYLQINPFITDVSGITHISFPEKTPPVDVYGFMALEKFKKK